jgi:hypothetical protein
MDADVNDVPQPCSLCKYTCFLSPFSPVNFRPPISLSTKMCNVSFLLYDLSYKYNNLVSSYCCSMICSADAWLLVQSFIFFELGVYSPNPTRDFPQRGSAWVPGFEPRPVGSHWERLPTDLRSVPSSVVHGCAISKGTSDICCW